MIWIRIWVGMWIRIPTVALAATATCVELAHRNREELDVLTARWTAAAF